MLASKYARQLVFEDFTRLLAGQTGLHGFFDHTFETIAKQRLPRFRAAGQRIAANGQPTSAERFQYLFFLQLQVSPGDRVGVDRQVVAKLPDAGDHLSRNQNPFGDGKFDLPHNLLVNRHAVGCLYRKEHIPSPMLVY